MKQRLSSSFWLRMWAAFVASCYMWMSTVVALRHTDVLVLVSSSDPSFAGARFPGEPSAPSERLAKASKEGSHTRVCVACEWQAMNVCAALAAVRVAVQVPPPRYLGAVVPGFAPGMRRAYPPRGPPLLPLVPA
ncbi:MAG: hypothetical protein ACP5VE_03730 [Chthonomonadales bacterium]